MLKRLLQKIGIHLHTWKERTIRNTDGFLRTRRRCDCGGHQELLVTGAPGVGIEEHWDDVELCFYCSRKEPDEEWWPYCGPECAIDAETDSAGTGILMGEVLGPAWESLKFQRRGCWHQNGQPKIRHKTESAAWEHARELVARGAHGDLDRLRVYRCRHCDQWHVGHVGGV